MHFLFDFSVCELVLTLLSIEIHKVLIVLPYCLTFIHSNCLLHFNVMNFSFQLHNLFITISRLLFLLYERTMYLLEVNVNVMLCFGQLFMQ